MDQSCGARRRFHFGVSGKQNEDVDVMVIVTFSHRIGGNRKRS